MSDTTDVEKLSYNVEEAVKASGLSRATLYRMKSAGDLKMFKARGRTLIRKAELERVLEKLESEQAA